MSEKPAEIYMELGRKGERKEETEINIQSGMAEEIKLEEQKGVQRSLFASNFATTLWPGIRYKVLAVSLPHAVLASAEDDSSLLLSFTLLAEVRNTYSEYKKLQMFMVVMVIMVMCDKTCSQISPVCFLKACRPHAGLTSVDLCAILQPLKSDLQKNKSYPPFIHPAAARGISGSLNNITT